jgi:hypothetical protein
MSRSVVVAKPIKPPKELEMLFDNPPLVGAERRQDYDKLLAVIAMAIKPGDAILWILGKDVLDLTWEIMRDRGIKTAIIKRKQKEAERERYVSGLAMTRADFERQKAATAAGDSSLFKKKEPKPEPKVDDSLLLVEAYLLDNGDIDDIDRRIASLECRRNAALREIDRYSESLARKLDKVSSQIIDGDFTEAEE